MSRRDEDPRPSIEIWEHDPAAESTEIITTGPRPRHPRAWALALLAGVVAVLLGGIVLGDDDPATEPEAAGAREQEADDGTATDGRGTTTRPEPTSTTEVLPGAPLLGARSGLLLVTSPYNGGLGSRIIDLDTGHITRIEARALAATEEGLLIADGYTVSLWPAPYDGSGATDIATTPAGQVVSDAWVVDGGRLVWLVLRPPVPGAPGFPASADLVDLDGNALAHIDIRDDLWPSGAIERGVVVAGPGGTYTIAPDGTIERISIGDLVSVANDRVYVYGCDERFQCSIEVFDGQGRHVDRRPISGPLPGGQVSGAIAAPDGRLATILYGDMEGGPNQALVDGVSVLEAVAMGNPTWSPDGRWLIVATDEGIHLVDTRGDMAPVVLDIGSVYDQRQVIVSR